jgi:hypothetical protein
MPSPCAARGSCAGGSRRERLAAGVKALPDAPQEIRAGDDLVSDDERPGGSEPRELVAEL